MIYWPSVLAGMATPPRPRGILTFGPFEVRTESGELFKHGTRLRLQNQPFQVLSALLARPGEVVTREELRSQLWPDGTFVDFEHGLRAAINRLRETLSDDADKPRYIETLPRRGYRFIAPVQSPGDPPPAEPSAPAASPESREIASVPARGRTQWIVLATALLVVLISLAWILRARLVPQRRIQSLAVLPLANLTGDAGQEYFADGMTEELITALAQIHSLRVISRTSVTQFKQPRKKLPEIAAELNVDAVVEGSVLRSGDQVRITVQLLDARQDRHLWAASYERPIADVLSLQNELARGIAGQVRAALTPEEGESLAKRRPMDPRSFDALLVGRFLWNRRNAASAQEAIANFQKAIDIDPQNAAAWAALGGCYASLGADLGAEEPAVMLPKAKAAVAKALQIDPSLAEAHSALGWIHLWYERDWTGAEREFRRAIDLNPNDSLNHNNYAHLLMERKRFDEALAENRRAIDLAPLNILPSIHLAWLYVESRQADKAVEQCRRVLQMDPNFRGAYVWLARSYELQAKWPEAMAAYEQAKELYGVSYLSGVARAWAASGDRSQAQSALARLKQYAADGHYISPVQFAAPYAAMGDKDAAFTWLEKAYREGAPLIDLDASYRWDALRDDPRFADLLKRTGFAIQ